MNREEMIAIGLSTEEVLYAEKFECSRRPFGGTFVEEVLKNGSAVAIFYLRCRTSTVEGTATWHGLAVLKDGELLDDRSWMIHDYPDDRGSPFEQREKMIQKLLGVNIDDKAITVEIMGDGVKREEVFPLKS